MLSLSIYPLLCSSALVSLGGVFYTCLVLWCLCLAPVVFAAVAQGTPLDCPLMRACILGSHGIMEIREFLAGYHPKALHRQRAEAYSPVFL